MKRKLGYIFLLLLLGHMVLRFFFASLSANRNELVLKLNAFVKLEDSPQILILGDSHAERGLDMKQMPEMFSLAYYGENNVLNYYRLKYCIESGKKISYVVLPCDIVTFSKGFNAYRTNKFFYYSLIPFSELKEFEQRPLYASFEYLKAKTVPYAEWRYGLNIWSAAREQKGLGKFSDRSVEERKKNAAHFIQTEMGCMGKRENLFYSIPMKYLEKILALCKEHKIKPVFVKYPLTREVFDEVRNHIGEDCVVDRPSERLLKAQSIPIIDLERQFESSPELFFDCHHLNKAGQARLTPVFKARIDSLVKNY